MTYDCSCDYEPASFYVATQPRARKQHKCDECPGRIMPGEKYQRVSMGFDGSASTFKTCERCYDLRTWVKNNVPCLCIMHGNQDEKNDNAIQDAAWRAKDEVAGLLFGYLRRKVLRDKHNQAPRNPLIKHECAEPNGYEGKMKDLQQAADDAGAIAETVATLHKLLDKFHADHGTEIYERLERAWPDAHRIASAKPLYDLERQLAG